MAALLGSITRAATRLDGEPLNVLCMPTHERQESAMARTFHQFYAIRTQGIKDWNRQYAPLPSNYTLLNPSKGDKQIPADIDFDLILSQNRFGQHQIAQQLSASLHLPLLTLEHTLPVPNWPPSYLEQCKAMRGHINAFISEYSVGQWGWDMKDPTVRVIHHGVDTETFSPNNMIVDRKPRLLSVVNDWKNRDWCCGFKLWQQVTDGLPVHVVGDTPGLSKPAASIPDLVMQFRSSQIFVNTSLVSPIPTVLLEAMSCSCAIISTANCMIPEIIEHGVNGLISNEPTELRSFCERLLKDPEECQKLGRAARHTIAKRFSMANFVRNWDALLRETAIITYTGV